MPSSDKSAKSIGRFSIGLNVFLQVLLGLFLFGVVNYLSWRTYKRWDLTAQQAHTLSERTVNYLEAMEKPVKLTVLFTRGTPLSNNVYDLVEEYKRAAGDKIEVEYIDPVRQPNELENLKSEYNFDFSDRKDGIILEAAGAGGKTRSKFIEEDDFVILHPESRRLRAFMGETALTSGLLAVSEEKQPVIKLVTGKGRLNQGKGGETAGKFLTTFASEQNAAVVPLDLADPKADLLGADIIVFINLKSDLTEDEADRVREYFESKRGSMLVMLNPDYELPKFTGLLKEYGVIVRPDRVVYVTYPPSGPQIDWSVNGIFIPKTVVSKAFREFTTEFAGVTQSLEKDRLNEDQLASRGIVVKELIQAADHFWADEAYNPPKFDAGVDVRAPNLALAVEMGSVNDSALRIDSSRMIVIGNATLLDPPVTVVHGDFISSSLNWMLSREEMIGIKPKEKQYYHLDIDAAKSRRVFQIIVLALPISVIFFGLFVWSMRRA